MHQAKAVGVSILRQPLRRNQKQQQACQTMGAQIIELASWVLLCISICCRLQYYFLPPIQSCPSGSSRYSR